jgi:hypothetical protein
MAGKFYLIGFVAGIILIAIGTISIFISQDEFAFIRGMMLIITGIIILALGIRFKAIGH